MTSHILPFTRRPTRPARARLPSGTAQIIIFPGVRYERGKTGPVDQKPRGPSSEGARRKG